MSSHVIVIFGTPIALSRPRYSKGHFYDSQKLKKLVYCRNIKEQFNKEPLNDPLILSCTFIFEIPKSWSKAKRKAFLGKPHTSKPDLDNLLKWVLDCGNQFLWKDDAQIATLSSVRKVWGEEAKTIVEFWEVYDY